MTVLAFELKDGKVSPCEYAGPQRMCSTGQAHKLVECPKPLQRSLTPRERRRAARARTRGRRGARRVGTHVPVLFLPDFQREVAHYFSHKGGTLVLYLPEWQPLTEEHADALLRALPYHERTIRCPTT